MALKTGEKVEARPPETPPSDTVLLELAMYNNYTWGGVTYHRETAYRFKRDEAMLLLAEQDHERPVWRQWQPPKTKRSAQMPIVDSTEVKATRSRVSLEEAQYQGGPGTNTGKRIDVGSDDEIADILNRPDADLAGDVTV